MKHLAVMQRWDGEKQQTICLEYPMEKKDECLRAFETLKKDAHKRKFPVTYTLIEIEGEMQYIGKDIVDFRKKHNVDRIIIANGTIYDDIPVYVQRDMKKD